MYVITQDGNLIEVKGNFQDQLKNIKVTGVLLTNPQDPLNKIGNQILSWCGENRPNDDYESIIKNLQDIQHK